jgi:EmrB/QacA subfamily drug resistance transporter
MTRETGTTSTQRWALTLASVASLMVMLDMMVVTTALSTIRRDLGATIDELEWTIGGYTLSFAVLLMTAAALGDRYGRRRLLMVGLGVFTAASAGCALAPGMGWLILGRVVQGAGAAMVMPHAMTLLSAAFPAQRRARALGLFSSVTGLATVGGPVLGGAVTQGLAWPWIFWLNVPLGLVTIPLVRLRMVESRGPDGRLDVPGLVLAGGGALGLVWGLVRANVAGWSSVEVLGAFAAGAVLLVGFVRWELRAPQPMLPLRYFRVPAFWSGNAACFLLYGSTVSAMFFAAQYFQTGLGYGPLSAGLRLVPWTVTLFVVAPLAGRLVNRLGERRLIVGGLLAQAAGFAWLVLAARSGVGYPWLVPAVILAGCGVSMAMPATQNAVLGAVPAGGLGKASGTFNTMRQLGGTFGIAIVSTAFAAAGGYASFGAGFRAAIGVGVGLSVLGAVAGAWTPDRRVPARLPVVAAPALEVGR